MIKIHLNATCLTPQAGISHCFHEGKYFTPCILCWVLRRYLIKNNWPGRPGLCVGNANGQACLISAGHAWGRLWVHSHTRNPSTHPNSRRADSLWSPLPWRRGRGAVGAGEGLPRDPTRFSWGQFASNKHLHFVYSPLSSGDCGWAQGLIRATNLFKNLVMGHYSWLSDSPIASDDCLSPTEVGRCSLWAWESPRVSLKCPSPGLVDCSQNLTDVGYTTLGDLT